MPSSSSGAQSPGRGCSPSSPRHRRRRTWRRFLLRFSRLRFNRRLLRKPGNHRATGRALPTNTARRRTAKRDRFFTIRLQSAARAARFRCFGHRNFRLRLDAKPTRQVGAFGSSGHFAAFTMRFRGRTSPRENRTTLLPRHPLRWPSSNGGSSRISSISRSGGTFSSVWAPNP